MTNHELVTGHKFEASDFGPFETLCRHCSLTEDVDGEREINAILIAVLRKLHDTK